MTLLVELVRHPCVVVVEDLVILGGVSVRSKRGKIGARSLRMPTQSERTCQKRASGMTGEQ